jgi:hypothetical protein
MAVGELAVVGGVGDAAMAGLVDAAVVGVPTVGTGIGLP